MSPEPSDSAPAPAQAFPPLRPLHWAGIALAVVTGGLHLWLGVTQGKPPLTVAGVGFAAGIAALARAAWRRRVVGLGIPFTAGQILLYAVGHFPDDYAGVGLGDKAVQVPLVAVLVVLWRRE